MKNLFLVYMLVCVFAVSACTDEQNARIEQGAAAVGQALDSGSNVAVVIPGAQPFIPIFKGLSVIALAVAGIFARKNAQNKERADKNAKVASVVMDSVDAIPGVGKTITAATLKAGVSKEAEALYKTPL